jgi:hypothetical protein
MASLEEASDVEEALMAAELAMEFKESEHPRNKDGEFNNKKASKGAASLGKNYRKALTVLNSQVTWHDKSQESKQAMIDALAESPASRLKREYNEFEDIYLETQGNLHRTGHSGVAEDEANSTDESTRGRQEDYLAKLRDFGARMELLEAALEKGHKLRMDDEGRWKVIELSLEAYFAFDIFNRQAQGILNRAMKAAKGLSRQAKESLIAALKLPSPTEVAHAVVQFVEKYRIQLARLLTTTQLAAVLEGAKEVAKKLPVIPPDGLGAPLPASISPAETTELVERIRQMPEEERWRTVYSLPADQQRFVLAQMRISGGIAPPPVLQAPADEDEGIHFPIIDEAVRELSSKNVIDRYSFDRLDAAARQKAFTVARVDADETLIRIRDALAENVRTGADFETFKESVLQDVEAGTFMSDGHLENVFRTNVQTAFSDGQMNVLSDFHTWLTRLSTMIELKPTILPWNLMGLPGPIYFGLTIQYFNCFGRPGVGCADVLTSLIRFRWQLGQELRKPKPG